MKYHQVSKTPENTGSQPVTVWESSAVFSKKDDPQSPKFHCSSTLHVLIISIHKNSPKHKASPLGNNDSNKNKDENIENDTSRILAHAVFFILCQVKCTSEQRQAWEGGPEATWHAAGQGTWLFPNA